MTALTVLVRRLGGLPLVAAALLIAAPAQAGPTEDTLKLQGDRWNAAYSAGDWTALRALYADDAWLMTDKAPALRGRMPSSPISGAFAIPARWCGFASKTKMWWQGGRSALSSPDTG